jgi:hypothetical protein
LDEHAFSGRNEKSLQNGRGGEITLFSFENLLRTYTSLPGTESTKNKMIKNSNANHQVLDDGQQ